MRYVEYGNTGKKVSTVGFGGMRFDLTKSNEENAELIKYASSKGINYFDTAPGYCEDKSEDIFGLALQDMPNDFYISTKGMPTKFDTAEKAMDAVKRSLERLKVDKIDFYHIWCLRKMEHYDLAMKKGGQYEGLLRLKEEGLIDNIVCSSHQPGHEISQILSDGKVDGVLLGMNILNFPYRQKGVEAAAKYGYGVAAMNPLSGGMIPQYENEFEYLKQDGLSATESALSFLLGNSFVDVTLVGFTSKEHIDIACKLADEAKAVDLSDLQRIEKKNGENMNAVCTGCGYCWDCPVNIPVPAYMQFYNEKQMFNKPDDDMIKNIKGNREWGVLAARKADSEACIACEKCEEACTQHLPIISRLKETSHWENQIDEV